MASKEIPKLDAQARERCGTRYSKRLRKEGRLPAVVYGHKQGTTHVTVSRDEVTDMLMRHAHLVEVATPAGAEPCLIKDVQWDHLGSTLVHVDFARVDLTEKVEVEVEIVLVGEAPGLKEDHTYLDQPLAMLEIRCMANDIPDSVKVDISALDAGDSISVEDITLPSGVEAVTSGDAVIASVKHAAAEEEPEEAAEDAAAEPELLKKGKEDEEAAAED